MDHFAIVTAFGQDRPGIVALMADSLYQLGCNIEDSCMTRLRGEFTMMLMVRLPQGIDAEGLGSRLTVSTRPLDLAVLCRALPDLAALRQPMPEVPTFMLSVYGADHPGIVAQVARTVADQGGNITDMNTRVIGSGEVPVYVMVLEIQLPQDRRSDQLKQALEALKPLLGVDLTFRPLDSVTF
ncbi:MAG: ACT domain-containing protein [Nitrospira sp.]|nr:ACT domain-containing protein [Nitrospira sp.]MCW5796519.1 ACT domain-containing protein [Nitrospira sp.]